MNEPLDSRHRSERRPRTPDVGVVGAARSMSRAAPGTFTAVVSLTLLSAAAHTAVPLTLKAVIDGVSRGTVAIPLLVLVTLALFAATSSAAAGQLVAAHGEKVVAEVRGRLARTFVHLHPRTSDRLGHGTLVTRIAADAAQFRTPFELGLTQIPTAATTLVVSLALMAWLDPVLLAAAAGVFAAAGLSLWRVLRSITTHSCRQQSHVATLANRMSRVLAAGAIIRSYGHRDETVRDVTATVEDARDSATSVSRLQSTIGPTLELAQQMALLAVLLVGMLRIHSGALEFSSLAAFLLYLFQLVAPLNTLGTALGRAAAVRAAQRRVVDLLAMPSEDTAPGSFAPPPPGLAARFADVTVDIDGRRVLDGVSFDVPVGGVTALVGPSGSGKSTVFSTLLGTETVSGGSMTLAGADPVTAVAYVDQDATLYPGTLRQNLCLGRRDAPDETELDEVLATVGLDDLPGRLEGGYDHDLSGAAPLSGGERQRLSIARAVLSRRPLVLADEPTAHLDGPNERAVHRIFRRIAHDRAVLMITHRAEGSAISDRLVALRAGRTVDRTEAPSLSAEPDAVPRAMEPV